jgi:class 3 adenylate cyclase
MFNRRRGAGHEGPPATVERLRQENAQLQRAVEELAVLNDVAVAVAGAGSLDEVLHAVVARSARAVGAEQGVVVLVEEGAAGDTVARAVVTTVERPGLRPTDALVGWVAHHRHPLVVNDPAADARFRGDPWPAGVRTLGAAPLLVGGRLVGVLAAYNKRGPGGAFTDDDARLLGLVAGQSAQLVERVRLAEERRHLDAERAHVLRLFGQHTAPSVVEALLREGGEVGSRRAHACVMFLDLRGFSTKAEVWAPEEVVAYLNAVFDLAISEVAARGGVVHQLLGDGLMALFGIPVSMGADCVAAVAAALAIDRAVAAAVASGALPPTEIGIGLHAGEVVAGPVGSAVHKEYKATGDVVNVASRIEGLNKELGSRVLASAAVWARLPEEERPPAEALGALPIRGRREPVVLYRLA